MGTQAGYNEETYAAILSLLLTESIRTKVPAWIEEGKSVEIVAKRLEQIAYSDLPDCEGKELSAFWFKVIRVGLRKIDWEHVVQTIVEQMQMIESAE